jgi:hypothetical protein
MVFGAGAEGYESEKLAASRTADFRWKKADS